MGDQEKEKAAFKQAAKLHEKCERAKEEALRDPTVKFMVQAIKDAGCTVTPAFFACESCDAQVLGAFTLEDKGKDEPAIVLCENHLMTLPRSRLIATLNHELIHAYDHCRAKVNWSNPKHHACSEIRAAALSSDCHWRTEMARGNAFPFSGGHQRCVKRRAAISVANSPVVTSRQEAMDAVKAVFDICYNDPKPFDYQPVDW